MIPIIIFEMNVVSRTGTNSLASLQDESLQIRDSHEIPRSFPDLCVAFKLMQEAGRLINLYDWMQV